jgi:excisionase family DNA binding protein
MSEKYLNPKEILTSPQACALLGISRQTLYNWLHQGRIKPFMKVGGASWLFIRSEVEPFKESRYRREPDIHTSRQRDLKIAGVR